MAEEKSIHRMKNAVAAYVLDASGPGEADAVRAHLATCSVCRALERRLRPIAAALPLAAPAASPPTALRARILDVAASATPPTSGADGAAPLPNGVIHRPPQCV
jgi:anti-sigma factor RsiW